MWIYYFLIFLIKPNIILCDSILSLNNTIISINGYFDYYYFFKDYNFEINFGILENSQFILAKNKCPKNYKINDTLQIPKFHNFKKNKLLFY